MSKSTPLWAISALGLYICTLNLSTTLQVAQINASHELSANLPLYRDGRIVGEVGESEKPAKKNGKKKSAPKKAPKETTNTGSSATPSTTSNQTGTGETIVDTGSGDVLETGTGTSVVTGSGTTQTGAAIVPTDEPVNTPPEPVETAPEPQEILPPPPEPEEKGSILFNPITLSIVGVVLTVGIGLTLLMVVRKKRNNVEYEVAPDAKSADEIVEAPRKPTHPTGSSTKLEDVIAEMEEEKAPPTEVPDDIEHVSEEEPEV